MGDTSSSVTANSTSATASQQPSSSSSGSAAAASARLNPDAKDYVPRTIATPSADGAPNGSQSNNRRRRNPGTGNKSEAGSGRRNGHTRNTSNTGGNTNSGNENKGSNSNNRNRRNNGRSSKSATSAPSSGKGRIDDDDDDDIEIIMDYPTDPATARLSSTRPSAPASVSVPTPTAGSGPTTANKDRRNDSRRKGQEVASDSQPNKRQGDRTRSRAIKDGQGEGSSNNSNSNSNSNNNDNSKGNSSSGNSNNNTNNNNRRQRNRKGDLGGRTFPTSVSSSEQTSEGNNSRPTRVSTPKSRPPAKFVHKVEEDRDLLEALTVGLTNSTYDCMVCWDVIRPGHKTWCCQVCYAAFHLDCISTWAKKSSEGLVTRVLALHAAVWGQFSTATVVQRHSSCAASTLTLHSRQESLAAKYAANSWDVASTLVPLYVMQDSVLLVRKNKFKSVSVASMNERHAVATEMPGPPSSTASSKPVIMNAMRLVSDSWPVATIHALKSAIQWTMSQDSALLTQVLSSRALAAPSQ
ncbi:hypothetical protein BGZ94_007804 [Podila epigama]|nr:hypothetical protein BGZ94_007804 [Podila epigama]